LFNQLFGNMSGQVQGFFTYRYNLFLAVVITCLAFLFSDQVPAGLHEDSLLMTGARSHQVAVVGASLEQGAYVNSRDELGRTPLMWSADDAH